MVAEDAGRIIRARAVPNANNSTNRMVMATDRHSSPVTTKTKMVDKVIRANPFRKVSKVTINDYHYHLLPVGE